MWLQICDQSFFPNKVISLGGISWKVFIFENVLGGPVHIDKGFSSCFIEIISNTETEQGSLDGLCDQRSEPETPKKVASDLLCFPIDTLWDDAFGHWVLESAIYLPLYVFLKTLHPTLKLLLKSPKNYKNLFLRYFNITEDDILYIGDLPKTSKKYFIPSPISKLNEQNITETWKKQVRYFFSLFDKIEPLIPGYDFAIMPRSTIENYAPLDRIVNFSDVFKFTEGKNRIIIKAEDVKTLEEQIRGVKSSSNIFLVDGSALHVNGLFVRDKTIYLLNSDDIYDRNIKSSWNQALEHPKYMFIHEMIMKERNNTLHYVTATEPLKISAQGNL